MKLATVRDGPALRLGVVVRDDTRVFDPRLAAEREGRPDPAFASMLDLIDAGPAALDRLRGLIARRADDPVFSRDADQVTWMAPLPEPRQFRDAMTFALHILQAGAGLRRIAARLRGEEAAAHEVTTLSELPQVYKDRPIYYLTNRFSVVGPGATVRWPRYSQVMDYELELAVVLGRTGHDVTAAAARDHVFGYTIYNDFSARDIQTLEMTGMLGPAKGKSFDTGNALGPWIVTRDELPDPYSLEMRARINGETVSQGHSGAMMYTFEDLIAYISRDETLHAGEVIGSGTMGNGCGLEHGRFLEPGDIVELEVERIGVLRNTVVRQD